MGEELRPRRFRMSCCFVLWHSKVYVSCCIADECHDHVMLIWFLVVLLLRNDR
jgi:hypothetical protein